MPNIGIMKQKRIAAGILAFLMLFAMLFPVFYIAAEANHHCSGEDCPVCACISQCEAVLHQMGDGQVAQIAVFAVFTYLIVSAATFVAAYESETPVSRKVRMNN